MFRKTYKNPTIEDYIEIFQIAISEEKENRKIEASITIDNKEEFFGKIDLINIEIDYDWEYIWLEDGMPTREECYTANMELYVEELERTEQFDTEEDYITEITIEAQNGVKNSKNYIA